MKDVFVEHVDFESNFDVDDHNVAVDVILNVDLHSIKVRVYFRKVSIEDSKNGVIFRVEINLNFTQNIVSNN